MTDTQDLIAQLRALGIPDWAMARVLMTQAADTLEALQAEVKHLNLHLKATQSGRDAALAGLAKLEPLVAALLHQIEISDFVDRHGHSAKMLRAVFDLKKIKE